MFSGIGVLKANAIENTANLKMANLASVSQAKNMHLVQVQSWFFPLMILLIGFSNILVIFIGGNQYINGSIELGVLAEFIIYVNMLTWPVATVGWVTSIVQQAEASQQRINEFLGQEPEIQSPVKTTKVKSFDIHFEDVNFQYDNALAPALENINFSLESGKTLAILGKVGSGKTTLINLIGRLYDTSSGVVKIGGVDVRQADLSALRQSIAYVPQEAFLFSDTLSNNIKFGDYNASDKEIATVAKWAAVHDNIMDFSDGYETVIGERGVSLSGGQKQRISIARALIKKPKILLLDDALSAVDTETEETILEKLQQNYKGVTTIIVCHRISSAKNADYIMVLDKGRVSQYGSHAELANADGYYADLYAKQQVDKTALES
jgi:ATP-binding cassette subfamily B protein